ncbi:MAG: hypothetical protein CFE22_04780 [Cytophagaceae bacterium BCCC1]|nr:MAG: hypothetical protein CFE22_04780 [Cytophagaceae bacterium BCCC1]
MKKVIILSGVFLSSLSFSFAQNIGNVGVGTVNPHESAMLDISSNGKGLLIPRMSLQNRQSIKNPAIGLKVYQTDGQAGEYLFNGSKWERILTSNEAYSIAVANPDNWSITGNSGTSPTSNYIGTSDNQPLVFKVNAVGSGYINQDGRTYFGYRAGQNATGPNNTGIGLFALNKVTGQSNLAFGSYALGVNEGGNTNVAIGNEALTSNVSGHNNLAIGSSSLRNNVSGGYNIAIGINSLFGAALANPTENISIGNEAMYNAQSSSAQNVAIGANAMRASLTGARNVAIGYDVFNSAVGSGNIGIGYQAGKGFVGNNNLFIANTNTTAPLINGDFSAGTIKINVKPQVGGSSTLGSLAIGDFDALTSPQMTVPSGYRLVVQDGIITEKIKVALRSSLTDWADYVFNDDYKLMKLDEVEKYVKNNKHLPNVPSAEDLVKSGLDVAKINSKMMEKIEELTLYIIELNKRITQLEKNKL